MIAMARAKAWVHSLARKLLMTVGNPTKNRTTTATSQ
jgi:hypothetical protein